MSAPAQTALRAAAPPAPVRRLRAAVELAIDGDLRFISHHDEIRMLARALVRARWPVASSRGFNPKPRIVLPLPRALGMAAASHWALVELSEPRAAGELAEALAGALPCDCRVLRVVVPATDRTPRAERVDYTITLSDADAAGAAERIPQILAADQTPVERFSGPNKPVRTLDIRPFIESLFVEGAELRLRLRVEGQLTARPTEVLTSLGLDAAEYAHRVRQTAVAWNLDLSRAESGPERHERESLGKAKEIDHREEAAARSQEQARG